MTALCSRLCCAVLQFSYFILSRSLIAYFFRSVTAFFSVPIVYNGITFLSTKPLNSITTITDNAAQRVKDPKDLPEGAIPPIADLDLADVNRKLYL